MNSGGSCLYSSIRIDALRSSFADLPPEIRNEIYGLTLISEYDPGTGATVHHFPNGLPSRS
jgi:hypothetical protein